MKTNIFLLICISICTFAAGQEKDLRVVSASAASYEAGNFSLEWTLGEVAVAFLDAPSIGLSQGFHQPAYQIVSVRPIPSEIGQVTIFPNPFSQELSVNMDFVRPEKGNMELLDANGKSIWKKPFEGHEIVDRFSATALSSGAYVLVITFADHAFIQSYQLLKTQ